MGVTNYLTVNGEILSETRNGISTDLGVVKTQWFTNSTSTSCTYLDELIKKWGEFCSQLVK